MGWETSTGRASRGPSARGYCLGSRSCSKSRSVENVSFTVLLLYIALNKVLCLTGPLDDVLSFLITIGSPALAIYSLEITHLNGAWITEAFLDVNYPNSEKIPIVLSAFHHVPIRISHRPPHLHSLVVLHKNDGFWGLLFEAAQQTRRWSIPLTINFILVVLAVILTIVDSYFSAGPGDTGNGIAATWTFLLPLVIGWLRVGCEPEPGHLRKSLEAANKKAWVATSERGRPLPVVSSQRGEPVRGPPAIEFMKAGQVDLPRKDELRPVPLFNYSRAFVSPLAAELVLKFAKNAAANAEREIPVGNILGRSDPPLTWAVNEREEIADRNRIGTDDEVTEYCTKAPPPREEDSNPVVPVDSHPSEKTETNNPLLPLHDPRLFTAHSSRWATGIWKRVTASAALALALQWGTTGAAVVVHYAAPPAGLGCRSIAFLLYGVAGTVSFLFFLVSSILAHASRPAQGRRREDDRSFTRDCQEAGATVCRWLGKGIAILSAMGILLTCIFQTTGAFENCFCTSTTFDKGREDTVRIPTLNYVVTPAVFGASVGGLLMAFLTAILFGFLMFLGTPSRR